MERNNVVYLDQELYIDQDKLTIYKSGLLINLSPTEFLIIKCLIKSLNKPITAEEIIKYTWGQIEGVSKNELYVFINRIRKKVEDNYKKPKYLLSVHGYGYILYTKYDHESIIKQR